MPGLSPNSLNIGRTKRAVLNTNYLIVHPEYEYWRSEWSKIRDALAGEREVKRKGERYLRPLPGSEKDEYAPYLDRAVFYNMSSQTLTGMAGQVFRRAPTVRNIPTSIGIIGRASDGSEIIVSSVEDKFTPQLRRFAKDGTNLNTFAKTVCEEQIAMGRFGALIDVSATVSPDASTPPLSFAVGYTAENIIDWTIEDIYGEYIPTRIVLREFERILPTGPSQENPWIGRVGAKTRLEMANEGKAGVFANSTDKFESMTARPQRYSSSVYTYQTIYRELLLEPQDDGTFIYRQYVYEDDPMSVAREAYTPMIRGVPLSFIPFVFFGAGSNTAECEKPPLLDIVDLNLKHYATYAQLEHGRFYTALPIYYAPGGEADNQSEYSIGPSTVWEVPVDGKPGIIEFKGEGLKTLERALQEKEAQIAAIGGRLMPGMSKGISESDNQSSLREANEQSLLLSVCMALEEGMSTLVRYWLMFRDVALGASVQLRYEIDMTFLTSTTDARTLRVIQQLYQSGLIATDALYENLKANGLIPQSMTVDEFVVSIKNPDSFVGQPDVEAMRRGYANRAQELEQARVAREVQMEQRKLDLMERQIEIDEQKLAIAAKVDSTSVAATRALGDPEGAPATEAVVLQTKATEDLAASKANQPSAKPATPAKTTPTSTPTPPNPTPGSPAPKK